MRHNGLVRTWGFITGCCLFITRAGDILPSNSKHNKHLPLLQTPDSICILRLSALGDATHVVPVVNAIRQTWPQTSLTWVIGKPESLLLQNLPNVEFIVFDKRQGWRAFRDLRRQLAGRKFDVLLHMQVAARANLASMLIKAPIRLGWDRGRSRDRHHWFINHSVAAATRQHQVQGFLSFARTLGLDAEQPVWNLPVSSQDRQFAEQHIPAGAPVLVISPCSSHPHRNWQADHYAMVADFAQTKLGMRVVLTGGPGPLERQTGQSITQAAEQPLINLIGKDTLPQSMAILERAALLISPDSGPAHIANALAIPVIGLYACTWSQRSGPYNSLPRCVDHFSDAALQFRNKPAEQLRWGSRIEQPGVMDLIKPGEVIAKLTEFARQAG